MQIQTQTQTQTKTTHFFSLPLISLSRSLLLQHLSPVMIYCMVMDDSSPIARRTRKRLALWLPIATRTRKRHTLEHLEETNGVDLAGWSKKKFKGVGGTYEMTSKIERDKDVVNCTKEEEVEVLSDDQVRDRGSAPEIERDKDVVICTDEKEVEVLSDQVRDRGSPPEIERDKDVVICTDEEEVEVLSDQVRDKGSPAERERSKGLEVNGMKRRKGGLDMWIENHISDEEDDKTNVIAIQNIISVAQRTRSCFTSNLDKKNMKLGTLSDPICFDEDEVEYSSREEDNSDGGGNDVSDDVDDDVVAREAKRKVGSNDRNDETCHGYHDIQNVSTSNEYEHVRDEGKMRMSTKGKRNIHLGQKFNVMKVLKDSILEKKGEDPMEEFNGSGDDESTPPVVKTLPLKFTFGIEETSPPEKSEEEKELDKLWAQMELAQRLSEIDSVDPATEVEDQDSLPSDEEVDRAILCQRGEHHLILDEEIGLKCAFCSEVTLEIKYCVASFCKNPSRKSDRRDPGAMNHSNIFDELRSQNWCSDSHPGCDHEVRAEGTVWDIIPGIKSSMYPHQCEGFEFIWKNIAGGIDLDKLKNQTTCSSGSGCIISHAPGTGKTRLTIVFLKAYMKLHPACRPLIVAPYGMLLPWEQEFQKWNFDIPLHNLNKSELSHKENKAALNLLKQVGRHFLSTNDIRMLKLYSWKKDKSILMISYKLYEQLSAHDNFRKILLEVPGLVVFDEGHIPRNDGSRILQTLSNIKTRRRIILSGTPFQNNFEELYNTLCLARPKFAKKEGKWESLTSSITKVTDERLKCEKLKQVKDMIDPFVHVHKGSILQEKLPGLTNSLVILKQTMLQANFWWKVRARIGNHFKFDHYESLISVHPSLLLKSGEEVLHNDSEKRWLKQQRLKPEAGVKVRFVMELIQLSMTVNEKVLVFSQYLEPLLFIMELLELHLKWTEGKDMLYMDGKLDVKQRQSSINVFNDPASEARVLFASTRACSEGINLVGASRVVLLDVVWNPSVERQAICRAYRLGQKKVVHIYHLISSGTKEEEKYNRQVQKDKLSELVFSSSDRSGDQQRISPTVTEDKILDEMVQHEKLKHMFHKIAYRKEESRLT